ncbi:hypothetical protein C482_05696 [Natrialba chahannaoensis JCM 10990]|uniref:Uncharacterized protein n=1 Tax=Natrialba chahannaoensis JCM 10990 TaxID=1227492 RepID=M0AUS7_9EURY|nr:hypothetical protein [Natrialba chahannaoensis]ELZ02067.1 hypothetical protein C482_05696 [Natrialba chahannaoensis JCM 10990]
MVSELVTYEALFGVQLVGTMVLVAGLFMGGLTMTTVAGGLIILAAIVGHVIAAVQFERDEFVDEPGGEQDHGQDSEPAGHSASR